MSSVKKIKVEHRGVAERYITNQRLSIASKTIGTQFVYGFSTCNVSVSGLLIRSDKREVPFRENTILELTLDPDGKFFQAPVAIMGKVVRRVDREGPAGGSVDLGVSIIHFDGSESHEWLQCIDSIKSEYGHLMHEPPAVEGLAGNTADMSPGERHKRRQIAS